VADDSCPDQEEPVADEHPAVQGWLGGVLEQAADQDEAGQAGILGGDTLLEEAIRQLEADTRGEVFQIEPAGDLGSPKPQPMRIRVGHEPPAQDVTDDARPAGP
jgi:hypothetical protein